jgi:hypothetical protein
MPEPDIPHLAWPPRFDPRSGSALVDQSSLEQIRENVGVVLSARRASVIDVAGMGIGDQAFREGGVDLNELLTALQQWEPRAITAMTAGEIAERAQEVGITVSGGVA